jgi:hypothetical protein
VLEPSDHQHVVRLEPGDDLPQLRSVGLGARDLFLEHLGAANGHQLSEAPVRMGHPLDRRNRRATSGMRALMLRLDRRLGPLAGCRWFNALQIRGQGRALHVLIPRGFGFGVD